MILGSITRIQDLSLQMFSASSCRGLPIIFLQLAIVLQFAIVIVYTNSYFFEFISPSFTKAVTVICFWFANSFTDSQCWGFVEDDSNNIISPKWKVVYLQMLLDLLFQVTPLSVSPKGAARWTHTQLKQLRWPKTTTSNLNPTGMSSILAGLNPNPNPSWPLCRHTGCYPAETLNDRWEIKDWNPLVGRSPLLWEGKPWPIPPPGNKQTNSSQVQQNKAKQADKQNKRQKPLYV